MQLPPPPPPPAQGLSIKLSISTDPRADAPARSRSVRTLPRPARQVCREGEHRQKSFLSSKGLQPNFHCHRMPWSSEKAERNRAANFTIKRQEKGSNIISWASVCICACPESSPTDSYEDTDHGGESLSLPDVRTIARLVAGVLRAREAVSRKRVYTHICPHV